MPSIHSKYLKQQHVLPSLVFFFSDCHVGTGLNYINFYYPQSFEGGYICGQDGVSECSVYIGVTASCTNNATRVGYALTATLNPLGNNIFQVPQVNQFVSAKRANTYKFCVDSQSNITAQIKSHADPCTCPASYANHDVLISRTFPLATKADLTWRMAGGNTSGTVELSGADTYTKPGTYYMNVFANCASDADCGKAKCTCSPCSNLPVSPYTLYVGTTADFSNGVSATVTLASCSVKGVLSGLAGQCVEVCPWEIQTVRSYKSGFLSIGAQVGISIGCLIAAMLLLGCYFYTRFEAYSCCRPLVSDASSACCHRCALH